MSWFGNSEGHAMAGRIGGKRQGKKNNPGNFANNIERAREAGRKGGLVSKKGKYNENVNIRTNR